MNNSYKLIKFARIGGNMNAYLKGMHRQKNIMSPHQAPLKFIIAQ
jgi:hypothetical protein